MTNEAPTPDEIDTMMSDIGSLVRVPFQVSRGLQTAKKLRAHITALEAENKRLREALEELARLGGSNGEYGNSIGNQIAKAALAQTGEK